nr:class I SAM-dependent methyltransferase [Antarcticibacterium sp. 1MA-6-2]
MLDVGCGAGSHSLYLQNNQQLKVTAIDISKGAVEVARLRGVEDAREINFFDLQKEKFDTILFLMNGTGIIGKLNHLDKFFIHSRKLLSPGGKIIIDSSDLKFLYDEDEDGGIWVDFDAGYYGELEYSLSYKGQKSPLFPWLYLDFNTLQLAAAKNGFSCNLIQEGEHYDYLAELQPT